MIGREQPSVAAIEGMARAFMVEDSGDVRERPGPTRRASWPTFRRRRRMRDGSEAWATVRSHPDPIVRAFLETIREAGVIQAADRVRALWSPKLIIVATDLPIDLTVDHLVTREELVRDGETAAEIATALRGQGWHLQVLPPVVRGGGITLQTAKTVIGTLLQKALSGALFPVLIPGTSGKPAAGTLRTHLPLIEAMEQAAQAYPGLRAAPPEGGVLRECLRKYGIVPSWGEVATLFPVSLPDARAVNALRQAEADELELLRQELPTVRYRIAGKRGRPSLVAYDPTRVPDIERTLRALFGPGVTVDNPPAEPPAQQEDADPCPPMRPLDDGPGSGRVPPFSPSRPAAASPIIRFAGSTSLILKRLACQSGRSIGRPLRRGNG